MAKNYFTGYTERQLKDYIKSVGKVANQRLRQLEKDDLARSSSAYKWVESQVLRGQDYFGNTNKNQPKFDLRVKNLEMKQLKELANLLKSFTEKKTTTKSGIISSQKLAFEEYQKQFKEQTGEDYKGTFADYSELYTDVIVEKFIKLYGSDEVQYLVSEFGQEIALQIMAKAVNQAQYGDDGDVVYKPDIGELYDYGNMIFREE